MNSKKYRSRSEMQGKRFGSLVVGEYIRYPNHYSCTCDCGRTVEMRTSSIALKIKAGVPVNCGHCHEPPKRRERRSYKSNSALAPDETPPPPCEKNGGCPRRDVCNMNELACLDFYRYVMGKPYGSGGEPIADLFVMAFSA